MIAIAHGGGFERGHVRASTRLGHCQAGNLVTTQYRRHHTLLERVAAISVDRWQSDGVRQQRGRDATAARTRHFFGGDQVVKNVRWSATQGLGVANPQNAQAGDALVQIARKGFGLVPFIHKGRDFSGHKIAQRSAVICVLGIEVMRQSLGV